MLTKVLSSPRSGVNIKSNHVASDRRTGSSSGEEEERGKDAKQIT